MKKTSKCYVAVSALAVALFSLSAVLAGAEEHKSDVRFAYDEASLIVVRTSAQWCKVCASTENAFAELKDQLSAEPVLFITLDRTDEASRRQAVYLVKALGIHKPLADGSGRVGTVMIVNTRSKRLIAKTQLSPNVDTMAQTIKKALASVS